jgi:[ribosomal protein S18]-alanine N-acetyltransferase
MVRSNLTLDVTRSGGLLSQCCLDDLKNSVLVRPGTERDFPAIARIQQHCPETAQWPLGDYAGFPTLIAMREAAPAGFCSWRQSTNREAELLNLAVDPAFRRQGVASALLITLAEKACGEIFLEVAEPNTAARCLYRKYGWRDVGIRKGYYNDGTVNAVVMKKGSW